MIHLDELYADPVEGEPGPAERAILRSAIDLFGRRGYCATSVRQIAALAGVTPPLIAYHFESKEGLFRACHAVVNAGIGTSLARAVEATRSLDEMVRGLTEAHLKFPQQHPAALRLLLTVAYGPEESQPDVDMSGSWASLLESVEGRIRDSIESGEFVPREGMDSVQLTRHLFRLMHMAVFEVYETERCPAGKGIDPGFLGPVGDPVADIHDQFFLGAGRLTSRDHQQLEEAR